MLTIPMCKITVQHIIFKEVVGMVCVCVCACVCACVLFAYALVLSSIQVTM